MLTFQFIRKDYITLTSARVLSVTSITNSRGEASRLSNSNFKILKSTVAPRLSIFEMKQYSRPCIKRKYLLNINNTVCASHNS